MHTLVDNDERRGTAALFNLFYFYLFNRKIIGDCRNIFYRFGGVFRAHLRSVRAVNFVAVIFFRVVTCRNHYAGGAVEFSDRVRKHGYGAGFGIDIYLYIVIQKNARCGTREEFAFVPRIVRNSHAFFHGGVALRFYKFRQALRCAANGVNVHFIRTVADNSAHACRTEFEFRAERVLYFFVVVSDRTKFVKTFGVKIGA